MTRYSPNGDRTRGTLNNCSHGVTPWHTYLAAEENWAGYFVNRDAQLPREHDRYGVSGSNSRYHWERADSGADVYRRFDASSRGADAGEDYPEWGAVDREARQVYFTLTNNSARTPEGVNAANPRPNNTTGHIIRWREQEGNFASDVFEWDIFILGGDVGTTTPGDSTLSDPVTSAKRTILPAPTASGSIPGACSGFRPI